MKKIFAALTLFVGICLSALGQNSSVSATVTDSDGQTWNNGSYQITFVPPTGYTGNTYTFNGSVWTPPSPITGTLSGIGVFTYTPLPRNDYILPANSHWLINICPNASFHCSATTVTVNASTQDFSNSLVLVAPRFSSGNLYLGSYGYLDIEVSPTPVIGSVYWNVTLGNQRTWNGSVWISNSGSGSMVYPPLGIAASTGLSWRTPVYGDIVALWASGSCSAGYLKYDGSCSTPSGSGTTTNAMTAAVSGGTAPSTTFDGSVARTFDYHSFGAQVNLSLVKGTYTDGDMCTYTASGTLLNCNTAIPSAYSLTLAEMATAASGATGCTTAGYAWVPQDSACELVGGGNSPQSFPLPNNTSTATGLGLMACWSQLTYAQPDIETCPLQSGGTDYPIGAVGVVTSGAGTSGFATVQYEGAVQWICDKTVTEGQLVGLSSSAAGECSSGGGITPHPGVPPGEAPATQQSYGRVLVTNAGGGGTAATIQLLPHINSTMSSEDNILGAYLLLNDGNGSSFNSNSYWQQLPSSYTIPVALAGPGLALENTEYGNGYFNIAIASTGAGGDDLVFDPFTNDFRGPMIQWKGGIYSLPNVQNASGTVSVGGSGHFHVTYSSGMYIWTLTGDATTYVPDEDNAGHILYFDIIQNASTAYTWTWPVNFINAPTVSSVLSSSTLTSFLFDGTNYQCLTGCAIQNTVSITANSTAFTCTTGTASIANASTGMVAVASAAGTHDPDVAAPDAWVSSNGTVTVQVCTLITDASAPAITYNIRVLQ